MKESVLAKILAAVILSFLSLGIGLAKGECEGCGCFIKKDSSNISSSTIEEHGFGYYPEYRKMIPECGTDICV